MSSIHHFAPVAFALLLFSASVGGQEAARAWSQWLGGPERTNAAAPGVSWSAPRLRQVWRQDFGSGYSAVAVAGGDLACLMNAGDDDVAILLDARTGEERWRVRLGERYAGHDGAVDGPLSTPAMDAQSVYALGSHGRFVCVDRRQGVERWSVDLGDEFNAQEPEYGFATSPLLAGGLVVVQMCGLDGWFRSSPSLVALRAVDGSVAWKAEEDEADYSSPALANFGGLPQVVVNGDRRLYAVRLEDGAFLWEHRFRKNSSWTPMVLPRDRVFLSAGERSLMLRVTRSEDLAWKTEVLWSVPPLARTFNPIAFLNERLYGIDRGQLSALDATNGELLWRHERDALVLAIGEHLAGLADREGKLFLGRPSTAGFELQTELQLYDATDGVRVESPLAYSDGLLFVRTDFAIFALEVQE